MAQDYPISAQLKMMYEESRFQEIVTLTSGLDGTLPALYKAKSHYALDQCSEALPILRSIKRSEELEIREDAQWTSILCLVQVREFVLAAKQLYDAERAFSLPVYRTAANKLKRDLLRFLTEPQLLQLSRMDLEKEQLLELYRFGDISPDGLLSAYFERQLHLLGVDSSEVASIFKSPTSTLSKTIPEGFVYRIGVLLPHSEDPADVESENSRALYNGLILAVDELNQQNNRTHIHLRFLNSTADDDSVNTGFSSFWMDKPVDVIFGPLYSNRAIDILSDLSAYSIPVILPLANSDQIHEILNSVIQLNPTFSVHGREMARFAVNTLGYDTLSVIADRYSLGYAAAVAFKEEAERLGALVPEFYAGDMSNTGYDIRPFTNTLFSDSIMVDSLDLTPVQAVYAPFTGAGAQTLIRLLMTDLAAKRNNLPVLGLEEWNSETIEPLRLGDAQIYYSSSFIHPPDSSNVQEFTQLYEGRFSETPYILAQTGYDAGRFIGNLLLRSGNPSSFSDILQDHMPFSGLRQTYVIRNSVNQSVNIYPLFRE